ncbi:haloacid dehalogenase [Collybia nuda]|uniref:Haloacid dehalogenase n=1 Tax=Collybia nuda TaxID=64659 RepID=A0A9P5XZJ1_9AGAR|nr:haloacid dehalogenase [Collybia nuda]
MDGVEALVFDVFGTVVDWRSSVEQELISLGRKYSVGEAILEAPTDDTKLHPSYSDGENWRDFAQEWRSGYITNTRRLAVEGSTSFNVDKMHREILDGMLNSQRWSHLGKVWDEEERQNLNKVWHHLNGSPFPEIGPQSHPNMYSGWPDATEGLYALKKQKLIATLSNGNVRLLVDMAKHADLPWDVIFSTELFDTFKPNPRAYQGVIRHLSLPPEKCAMVAAHIFDLRAAASQGMKTIYVNRAEEEWDPTNTISEEVDLVVSSFVELASILGAK